jgi:hypothetical protein
MIAREALHGFAVGLGLACAVAQAQVPPPGRADALDARNARVTIEAATFVTELGSTNASYKEVQPDKYRGVVVTLRIQKAENEPLTIFAQDVSLHYRYGKRRDVARCTGISSFSMTRDAERPLTFFALGVGSITTGVNTGRASEVFVDVFLQGMEPDTSEIDLYIAQPIGARRVTQGWK